MIPTEKENNPYNLVPLDCLLYLDNLCDGARTDDTVGFAAQHTSKGKRLAAKIRAKGIILPIDVIWLNKSLPYYRNTQLCVIDWDQFNKDIEVLTEIAQTNETQLEKLRTELEETYKDYKHCIEPFMHFDLTTLDGPDRQFVQSLQNWYKTKGFHTEKQAFYVHKIVNKYVMRQIEGVE